jgi:hypothetical protein
MVAAGRIGPPARGFAFRGLGDPVPRVRQAAAWAVCHGGDEVLDPLMEVLSTERDVGVRATALANLWRFDAVDWEAHARAAAAADDPQLRRAAAYSLARSERPARVRAALRRLAADADPVIRATAVAGFRRAPLDGDDAAVVARALADPDPRVRTAACWVLAEQPEPALDETDAGRVVAMWRAREPQLRVTALRAAAARPEIGDGAELLQLARTEEPWVAAGAAEAAVRRGADDAADLARGWLADGELWQRRSVASTGTVLGPEVDAEILADTAASVRLAWVEAVPDEPPADLLEPLGARIPRCGRRLSSGWPRSARRAGSTSFSSSPTGGGATTPRRPARRR